MRYNKTIQIPIDEALLQWLKTKQKGGASLALVVRQILEEAKDKETKQ